MHINIENEFKKILNKWAKIKTKLLLKDYQLGLLIECQEGEV